MNYRPGSWPNISSISRPLAPIWQRLRRRERDQRQLSGPPRLRANSAPRRSCEYVRAIGYCFQETGGGHMNKDKRLITFLAGVGVGAAGGLLVARYSGADLRKGIRKHAGEVKDLLKTGAEELVDRVQTAAEEGKDNLGSQLKKGKDAAREFSNKTRDVIETAADDATNAAEEILDKSRTEASKST